MLESLLDSLLKDNTLTSWTIQGKDKWTTVNIRFAMADMTGEHRDLKYKKCTLSQQKREANRLGHRKCKKIQNDAEQCHGESVAITDHNSLNIEVNNETCDDNVHASSSMANDSQSGVDIDQDRDREINSSNVSVTSQGIRSSADSHDNSCQSAHSTESDEDDDATGTCCKCSGTLVNEFGYFYKCTVCK